MNRTDRVIGAFLGLAVGDALGVPVEFRDRDELRRDPVMGMRAYGTHHQVAGTWSDDSAMAFCLAEALTAGYDLDRIAQYFVRWYDEGFWSAHGRVFDIGIATSNAIRSLRTGTSPLRSGNTQEESNGNGSLMRIMPLAFAIQDQDIDTRFRHIQEVSAITHAHIRSVISCFIYTELALEILKGEEKMNAYQKMRHTVDTFLKSRAICTEDELRRFHRVLENPYGDYVIRPLLDYKDTELASSGYCIHTLEASLWCFLKCNDYAAAVLAAVNLGSDSDTTGCVTGGLAGLYYGSQSIPEDWCTVLARKDDITGLATRLAARSFL